MRNAQKIAVRCDSAAIAHNDNASAWIDPSAWVFLGETWATPIKLSQHGEGDLGGFGRIVPA
jgi:hypothetical protein